MSEVEHDKFMSEYSDGLIILEMLHVRLLILAHDRTDLD